MSRLERQVKRKIGVVVRSARRSLGLTQAQLARLVGVHQGSISYLEQGRGHRCSWMLICALCDVLGMDLVEFRRHAGPPLPSEE